MPSAHITRIAYEFCPTRVKNNDFQSNMTLEQSQKSKKTDNN